MHMKLKKSGINFLVCYKKGQIVMNNVFLSYLELRDVFKLSMTCTDLKRFIDPASFKQRRRKNKKSQSRPSTFHLKRLAAN